MYRSWWASTDHPVGASAYWAIATIVLSVVALQNMAGLVTIYFIVTLPRVATFHERPFSSLANDGWEGMARAYRTVYFSLSLHGIAITLIVVVMGVDITWVAALVVAWLVVAPVYLWVPRSIFRRAILETRDREAEHLKALARPQFPGRFESLTRYQAFAWIRDELQAVESAPSAPLKMGQARVVSLGITAFSLFAAGLQTWLAWRPR